MRKTRLFMVILMASAISFAGCENAQSANNSSTETVDSLTEENGTKEENSTEEFATEEDSIEEPITEESTTEESTTEETMTEETTTEGFATEESTEEEHRKTVEYTCDENNIPAALVENVRNRTEHGRIAYLYGDIDEDNEKELLAGYLDESVGAWKIIRFENETAEAEEFYSIPLSLYFDYCSMELIELKDEICYVVNLRMSMGLGSSSYILEEGDNGVEKVIDLGYTASQMENGDLILESTYYGVCLDKTTGMMMGRTWGYSYLTYDEDSEQFKEYVANEITEEEFLSYEGAAEHLEKIRSSYKDYKVKYTFFKRNNGVMHVQCEYEKDYEDEFEKVPMIYYEHYTVYYEGNVITNISEGDEGIISRNFTSLEEA